MDCQFPVRILTFGRVTHAWGRQLYLLRSAFRLPSVNATESFRESPPQNAL